MNRNAIFYFIGLMLFFLGGNKTTAQGISLDSLLVLEKKETDPEKKLTLANKIAYKYISLNDPRGISLARQNFEKARKLKLPKEIVFSQIVIGIYYKNKGDYENAIKTYVLADSLSVLNKYPQGSITANANISNIHYNLGNYAESNRYLLKALDLSEKAKDSFNIVRMKVDIAMNYVNMAEYTKALNTSFEALDIAKSQKDTTRAFHLFSTIIELYLTLKMPEKAEQYIKEWEKMAKTGNDPILDADIYLRKGSILDLKKDYPESERYFRKAVTIYEKYEIKEQLALVYQYLGLILKKQKKYAEAIRAQERSLEYSVSAKLTENQLAAYDNLSETYFLSGNCPAALEFAKKALNIQEQTGRKDHAREIHQALSQAYECLGDMKNALKHHKLFVAYRDSLSETDLKKSLAETDTKYQTIQKELQIEKLSNEKKHQDEELALRELEVSKQRTVRNTFIGGFILLGVFSFFIFRSLKQNRRDKAVIENQKVLVEEKAHELAEKQKEILDSINYAKRLQQAILAPKEEIDRAFENNFLLYRPKDIVAGDFYFFEATPSHYFYAAADCTGHGVPGAMVSVVCSNALSRAVKEFDLVNPGKVLDKAREIVVNTFEKSGQDVKDGMDISLLVVDRRTGTFSWSGANNPLWIFDSSGGSIREIPAHKQPIGKTDDPLPFPETVLSLNKGDILYLFTDGFADQFGGPKGKKFKYKPMQELLIRTKDLSPEEQQRQLEKEFDLWKGQLEQVDDICIIGVRV